MTVWRGLSLRASLVVALATTGGLGEGATLLVVCQGGAEIAVVDTVRESLVARIPVAKAPAGVALSTDGRAAYVTHPDAGLLSRIDLDAGRVAATARLGGQPFGIATDPEGHSLYVSDWSADVVLRIEVSTLERTGTVPVGRAPAGLAIDPASRRLYSADRESDAVSVIDLATFSHIATVPVGQAPYAIDASDPKQLVVANVRGGDVAIVDKATHQVARVPVGHMPYGIAFKGDRQLLVTNQESGTVSTLDLAARKEIAVVRVGGYPEGLVVVPEASRAYVAEWFANRITALDLASGAVVARISVCEGPRALVTKP